MVEIGSQKTQNVVSSDRRSLGSYQYPSGRFPKVSIGITVEKCPKKGPESRKEDASALPDEGRVSSHQVTQEATRMGIAAALEGRRLEAEDQKFSAWFSTKSIRFETPTAETQVYVNRTSVIQLEGGVHKKLDNITHLKRRDKGGNCVRVEEVAFDTMQETQLPDKVANREEPEQQFKCNNESLKMKLWEILGTAPSQNRHAMNSANLEVNNGSLHTNQRREHQKGKLAETIPNLPNLEENKENLNLNQNTRHQKGKSKQNSDTIETDSESPGQAMRRPITRSLARKKAQPKSAQKVQSNINHRKKPLAASSSNFKLKHEKKNIFAFNEVERKAERLGNTASDHSNRSSNKINEQKKAKVQPRRIYYHGSALENSPHKNNGEPKLLTPDKTSSQSKEKGVSPLPYQSPPSKEKGVSPLPYQSPPSKEKGVSPLPYQSPPSKEKGVSPLPYQSPPSKESGVEPLPYQSLPSKQKEGSPLPCHSKKQFLQTVNDIPNDNHHTKKYVQNHFGSPPMYNAETLENTDSPLFKKKTHSWGYERSPSLPKNVFLQEKVACRSKVRETNPLDDFPSPTLAMDVSPTLPSMSPHEVSCSPALAHTGKLSQKIHSSKDLGNTIPKYCQSDTNTECSDDTREMCKSQDMESPDVEDTETAKKLCPSPMEEQDTESLEADRFTSKGTEDLNGSPGGLEEHTEDSLARSVAQLGLVLERFRTRIKSQTSKKSSGILSAAADKILIQLQDVETQMVADVGKFAGIGKSKRKRLELRFQEQQEKLKLIHDKFKEEVNQHVLDCGKTLEELESYHLELKGNVDRQKVSHRKHLLQAKEAMEAQINDAERSIAAIHKEERKKMKALKIALQMFMDDMN